MVSVNEKVETGKKMKNNVPKTIFWESTLNERVTFNNFME